MSEKYETREHDVLVIGAGGAGLRAAIEALGQGASVGVVCKSLLGKAHTVMAEGGIAAAMANVDRGDDWQTHFRDTMKGGKYLNNWRMAQLHAQEAPDRVRELEQWGALFDRTADGDILQRAFGGHTFKRLCHVGDRTGLEMIRTLQDRGVQMGFNVYMECAITRLLKDGDRVCGAFGYWREQGRFVVFKAKSVVLATGGIGKAWRITSNSWEYTGDGMSLAYEAGAELLDMEFVQFHPTGMVWPPGVQGILVTEAVRGEGGVLTNRLGERFMNRYDPEKMELSTRDVVARAIYTEVREGRGTEHGGANLDISHKPAEYVKKKLPSMYHQFLELADVDITKGPMEVGPTCHYMMGGVRVDAETASSTVTGLFAAGEAAAGLHGANRLGGNSLSDLLVFGRRAGLAAADHAKSAPAPDTDGGQIEDAAHEMLAYFERPAGESPYAVHRDLTVAMQELVGIFREEGDLVRGLAKIRELQDRADRVRVEGSRLFNPGWHLARDLRSMLTVSEAVARSALARKESRGAHSRIDYPKTDPEWGKRNLVVAKRGSAMELDERPVTALPADLAALLEEKDVTDALLKVFRGTSDGGELVSYRVPVAPGMVVLDALHHIQGYLAPDLAVRWNCKAGKCGSCSAEVNGRPRLTCKTRMDSLPLGEPVTVTPMKAFPVIRDLVTDVSWNYEVNRRIPPFSPRAGTDWKMSQADVDRVQEFRKCIECFLCQNVCHVLRDHDKKDRFGGPRFFVRVAGLEMHPLDGASRTKLLKEELGLGYCNITKCCTEVCPEDIHITDNAIIPLKERVVDDFYDPIAKLFRKAFR